MLGLNAKRSCACARNNEEFWGWIFVWQRLSFQQLLTWERNTCTQPRALDEERMQRHMAEVPPASQ